MARVLFINGPASGHVYPTLGLVEALIAIGEEVVYVSSEEFRNELEQLGAVFYAYENFLNREDPFDTKHFLTLVIKIISSYEVILPCVLEISKRYSFDYFIHDSMYGCGNVVSEFLGIPHIATCTSFINAERLQRENTRNPAMLKENLSLIKNFISVASKMKKNFNIKSSLDIHNVFFNEGMLNLVFTSDYFQPHYEQLGDHFKFVGPSITARNSAVHFPFIKSENTDAAVIYISMGTVFNDVKSLYQLCFEALASFHGQVILSVGNRIDVESLQGVPDHFTIVPFAPQLQVLTYTNLFITHGGMNSVNEALYYGVPLIVIPMAADQPIVGDRVTELGAGIKLERAALTKEILREAVDKILSIDDFHNNSAKIGETMRSAGGPKKAIQEIQLFKQAHNIAN